MEESIEEKEAVPEKATTETRQLSASRQKNRVIRLLKEMWPAYLIEIIVIILGISITLALEEWRDTGKEQRLEEIYLRNLLTDIKMDLQSFDYTSGATQKIIDRGNELLVWIKNPVNNGMSLNQLQADVLAILGRPKFVSNDATFSDLKSSGNLHLLKEIRLKNLLFAYYNLAQNIKEDQDAEQQATITLCGPFFFKNFSLSDSGNQPNDSGSTTIRNLAKNIEFGNNVLLRVTTRKELLDLYQRADSSAIRLKDVLSTITGPQ